MAKHESGSVRVIPADEWHFFHQINCYDNGYTEIRTIMRCVETIPSPGRHRK